MILGSLKNYVMFFNYIFIVLSEYSSVVYGMRNTIQNINAECNEAKNDDLFCYLGEIFLNFLILNG